MAEEKQKDLVQVLRTRRKNSKSASQWAIVLGFFILVSALAWNVGAQTFWDDEHLTTPDIPLKDSDNATYSFTENEVTHQGLVLLFLVFLGGSVIAIGYAMLFVNPGERELHRVHCPPIHATPGDYPKYCPECGMDLKKMEKYKND